MASRTSAIHPPDVTAGETAPQPRYAMPSIKEIIAAKAAAAAAAAAKESSATTYNQGKPKPAGIVLSRELPPEMQNGEPRGQRTPITDTPPEERRSLSEPEGEAIPMTPVNPTAEIATWHEAMNAFQTELCLMRDPLSPEYAWLAVRLESQPRNPILLHKLPFWEHPRTVRPDNQPF